ncbi:uncharacterized protein [Nothobranchius furzeri]|uniref:uncharacterized protein isoform X3 n=1 Tax=Nothobranchius furzeri TaxID=105023 RepID=UPI0039049456
MADQQELLWQRGRPLTSRQSRRRGRHKEESRPSQRHPLSWLDDDAEMVAACKSVEDSLISKQPTIGAAATRTSPKAPALQRLLVLLLLLIPLLLNPLLVR